jgi:hypothetical protein
LKWLRLRSPCSSSALSPLRLEGDVTPLSKQATVGLRVTDVHLAIDALIEASVLLQTPVDPLELKFIRNRLERLEQKEKV